MTANRIETQNQTASQSALSSAEAAKQALLNATDDDAKTRQAAVKELLHRAGAQSINTSSLNSTTSTTGATGSTVVRNEAINRVVAKNETEANLGPVTAPRIVVNPANAQGAENFAHNVDRVMTNHLNQMSTLLNGYESTRSSYSSVTFRANTNAATESTFASTGSGALANAAKLGKRQQLVNMNSLSSDQLLAEFLKLNINDPNSNVQTQDKLYQLASQMREMALEEQKAKIERAEKMMKDAQKYADQVQQYAKVMSVVGIATALLGPLGSIISGVMQIVMAIANYTAQMKMEDAKEEMNNAQRFGLMADQHQNQIEETTDVINTVMQNKNQMVDAVIKMLNAKFTTTQQLMSAAMAR